MGFARLCQCLSFSQLNLARPRLFLFYGLSNPHGMYSDSDTKMEFLLCSLSDDRQICVIERTLALTTRFLKKAEYRDSLVLKPLARFLWGRFCPILVIQT